MSLAAGEAIGYDPVDDAEESAAAIAEAEPPEPVTDAEIEVLCDQAQQLAARLRREGVR
jgi:hypothetical protein